jgi:RNA polymerase sigma factor (sigma-70 family)
VSRPDEHEATRPEDEPTDAELIAESATRPRAFMPLVERHNRVLFGYLARRLGADVAEELVSETYARAFELRHRYDTQRPDARPWLFGIATNLMRNHLRSNARQSRAFARAGVNDVSFDDDAAIDARLDASVHGEAIQEALSQLSPGDREALLLFAWGEMPYEDIAASLDIPVGTVRSRLNRARRQLKEALPQLERAMTVESPESDA